MRRQKKRKEDLDERLNRIRGEAKNVAKRYRLPELAVEIIEDAAKVHGQQSRAIQIAVEVIWRTPGKDWTAPASITGTPSVGKTYGLPPRTVSLIGKLTSKFRTRGNVLAACAGLLANDLEAERNA
jgi:hypothetical protein